MDKVSGGGWGGHDVTCSPLSDSESPAPQGNCRVRQVSGSTSIITTVVGTTCGAVYTSPAPGPGVSAQLGSPWGMTDDGAGGFVIAGEAGGPVLLRRHW